MIAVAKGLLDGLGTAAASATKKDENSPPFAETFQQVSADHADQATRTVTQRSIRTDGGSSDGKKASGSSSGVDSAEQAASGSSVGAASSVAKTDGKTLAPAVARVVEGDVESAGEQAVPVAAKEVADVLKEQVGVVVETQVKTALSAVGQPLVSSVVAQAASGAGKDVVLSSASPTKGDVSQVVETPADDRVKGFVPEVETQTANGGGAAVAQAVAIVPKSIPSGGDADSGSLSNLQQDSNVTGNALQSVEISFASKQTVSKTSVASHAVAVSNPSKTVSSTVFPIEPIDSSQVAGQVSTPVLPASLGPEDSGAVAAISGQTTGRIVAPVPIETQPAKSESGISAALAGNIPVHEASGSIASFAPEQVTKSGSGSTSIRTVVHDSEKEANGQMLDPGEPVSTANQSVQVLASGLTGIDVAAQATFQATAPKLDTNGVSSSITHAVAASIGGIAQGSEIVTKADVSKASAKHVDGTQVKGPLGAKSEVVTMPTTAVATDVSVSTGVDANAVAAAASTSASPASASAVLAAARVASDPTLVSSALQGGTFSAPGISSVANDPAPIADVSQSASPVVAGAPSAMKVAKASGGQSGVPVKEPDEPANGMTQGTVLEAAAIAPLGMSNTSGFVAGDGSLRQEAVVGAASSLVKSGSQRGIASGNTSVAKERKAADAETKPAAAPVVEAGPVASIAHASTAASSSTKPSSSEHQAVAVSGGQSTVAPVGNVAGAGLAAQSQVAGVAGSIAPAAAQVASRAVSADASMLGTNGAGATSQTSVQGADYALSPMAHTTLSATPTVLEVGVPGGTQGWLKIRAEIGEGGVVQASMSASTHAGQDALRRDLPAMTAFLDSERVPVSVQVTHGTSASVASLVDGNGLSKDGGFSLGSSLGQSLSQNANSSAGSGQEETAQGMLARGSGGGQNGGQQQESNARTPNAGTPSAPTRVAVDVADADWSTPVGYGSGATANGGSWLNVIA